METTRFMEYLYYAGSVLLPPIGLWWGFKYLKQSDEASKRIGWVCIILTTISTIVVTIWTVQLFQNINAQVNQQLQGIQGL